MSGDLTSSELDSLPRSESKVSYHLGRDLEPLQSCGTLEL